MVRTWADVAADTRRVYAEVGIRDEDAAAARGASATGRTASD
jgi:hypothetical protein